MTLRLWCSEKALENAEHLFVFCWISEHTLRKGDRVAEGARLEIVCVKAYRGFESSLSASYAPPVSLWEAANSWVLRSRKFRTVSGLNEAALRSCRCAAKLSLSNPPTSMSCVVLARKLRPQRFSDLIGQEVIAQILQKVATE